MEPLPTVEKASEPLARAYREATVERIPARRHTLAVERRSVVEGSLAADRPVVDKPVEEPLAAVHRPAFEGKRGWRVVERPEVADIREWQARLAQVGQPEPGGWLGVFAA